MQGFDLRRRVGIDDFVALVGPATTRGALFDLGRYPGAIKADGQMHGELYRMIEPDTLLPLVDAVEGFHPDARAESQYVRDAVAVTPAGGPGVMAWVYFYRRGLGDAVWIPNGDYRSHIGRSRGLCYDLKVSLVAKRLPERCP